MIQRFRYLHYGLSAVLVFIGVKMIAEYAGKHWLGHEHLIPHWVSLLVVAGILVVSVVASLVATRREAAVGALETQSDAPAESGDEASEE